MASALKPGDHGSTFGGGALVASAALAACRKIGADAFLADVRRKGTLLADLLGALALRRPGIRAVRGAGLIWGIELDRPAGPVVEAALERGLLVNRTSDTVIRLLPPYVITAAEIDEGIAILDDDIGSIGKGQP